MYTINRYQTCESTNRLAKSFASEIQGDTVFVSDEQTAGYGRNGNTWNSPKGGLWFTLAIKRPLQWDSVLIGLLASVAAQNAIRNVTQLYTRVKWPNDIMYDKCKVAGILVEIQGDTTIIGVGINTNMNEYSFKNVNQPATSLSWFVGRVDNEKLLQNYLLTFDRLYEVFNKSDGIGNILRMWAELLV